MKYINKVLLLYPSMGNEYSLMVLATTFPSNLLDGKFSFTINSITSNNAANPFDFSNVNFLLETYDDDGAPPPKPKPNKPSPTAKEVAVTTNESANKFAEDIGAKKQPVAEQLNTILKEMIPNSKKMGEVKTKIYNDMVKDTEVSEDVNNWTNKDMDKFLNRVEVFLEDENLVDVVFDTQPIQEGKEGDEMTDIPSGAWEQEPPTDKQLKTFNDKVAQATDDGQTELVKKAKDFLASGNATKKNIFDWIDTDGDWTLKDPS